MIEFNKYDIELSDIHRLVCIKFNISAHEIFRMTRKREIVEKRQLFCWLSRKLTKKSLDEIGKYIGRYRKVNLDHATVRHSCLIIENIMPYNKDILKIANDICIELENTFPYCTVVVTNVDLIKSCRNEKR